MAHAIPVEGEPASIKGVVMMCQSADCRQRIGSFFAQGYARFIMIQPCTKCRRQSMFEWTGSDVKAWLLSIKAEVV